MGMVLQPLLYVFRVVFGGNDRRVFPRLRKARTFVSVYQLSERGHAPRFRVVEMHGSALQRLLSMSDNFAVFSFIVRLFIVSIIQPYIPFCSTLLQCRGDAGGQFAVHVAVVVLTKFFFCVGKE